MANPSLSSLMKNARQSEVAFALAVMGILMLLFLPMPAFMMDLLYTISISSSVMILLTVMFITKALEFSAFPMLLLVTTLLRLALNIASTRLILSHGHETSAAAGKIIETFGQLVMGGQFVIGLILFLILVIINFVVITKGSTRIAEVAARFTLDSLPGKQMAIDADMNAGLINENEARKRRKELEQETGFFGAMDGASKFVRGDAIAGLIITALNIVVGISVGVASHGMPLGEAADRYMTLTVGDGLVAQIPAIITSIGAGLLVAKSGTSGLAGQVVFGQLGANPPALYATAGLLGLLGLLPNMPLLPFWFMGGLLIFTGYMNSQKVVTAAAAAAQEELQRSAVPASTEEPIASILHVDTLRLELGYGLLTLIDESKGGKLTEQIKAMRRQMAREIGFVVPSLRIQDNMQLDGGGYGIYIKDVKAGSGVLKPGLLMAMDPTGSAPPIQGEETVEPTFGLPARWVDATRKEEAQFNGYTVVDNATVIITHLTEIIKDNLADLLTRQETEKLLEEIKGEHGKLVEDLVPAQISISTLQKVLQNLLAERVSIRNLPTILEALADGLQNTKNISLLTEGVRTRLNRQLCAQNLADDGMITVVALSGLWEKEFATSLFVSGDDRQLAMDPAKVQTFMKAARDVMDGFHRRGEHPVVLTSPTARPFVRSVLERIMPTVSVLSQAEIHPRAKLKTLGTI